MLRTQITKKLGIGIGVVIFLFLAILTFGNFESFDEALSPEVREALKPQLMPSDRNNAFVAIWGLTTANDQDMIKSGKALIQRYHHNRDTKGQDELTAEDYREILATNGVDKTWQAKIGRCHVRKHHDCVAKLAQQITLEPLESQRLTVMLQRYQQIKSLSDYQHIDHLTFVSPLPPFGTLVNLSKLSQALAFNNQDPQGFITHLSSELKFWRMLLNKGDTVMDKMIANVGYWSNLTTTSNFLSTKPSLSETDLKELKRLLTPLSQNELDISEAFVFEEKAFFNSLQNIDADQLKEAFGLSASPIAWLIQPNATMNNYHKLFVKKIQTLGEKDTEQFAQAIKSNHSQPCCFEEIESLSSISLNALYNLGGKSLLSTVIFSAEDYLARIHDLNGLIGLVGLELSMLKDKTATQQWLKENTTLLGHTIIFDQLSHSIEFVCLDTSSVCKIQL